jgi:hypothetical protein
MYVSDVTYVVYIMYTCSICGPHACLPYPPRLPPAARSRRAAVRVADASHSLFTANEGPFASDGPPASADNTAAVRILSLALAEVRRPDI